MCKKERLAVYFERLRLVVHDNSAFLLQIAVFPDVMVPGEVMHLYAGIG